jgi:hypothetical protein
MGFDLPICVVRRVVEWERRMPTLLPRGLEKELSVLMLSIGVATKVLVILAIYAGLVLVLERRSKAPRSVALDTRHPELAGRNRARRNGRVA